MVKNTKKLNKKSSYKKWCFWGIVFILVAGIVSSFGSKLQNADKNVSGSKSKVMTKDNKPKKQSQEKNTRNISNNQDDKNGQN